MEKFIKKSISLFLVFCMMITMVPDYTAQAAENAETGIRIDQVSYDSNSRILTVAVQMKLPADSEGITAMQSLISYDAEKLTLMHKSNDTTFIPASSKVSVYNAINLLLAATEAPYTLNDYHIIGDTTRGVMKVGLSLQSGLPDPSQNITDWQTAYTLRFKVNGTEEAEKYLDKTALRIADPMLDAGNILAIQGGTLADSWTAFFTTYEGVLKEHVYGPMADNTINVDTVTVMSHPDIHAPTYPGSTQTLVDLTFNANSGSGTHDSVKVALGKEYTLPTTTSFTAPEGKEFKGWSLTTDGALITTITPITYETVYAIWEDITLPAITGTLSVSGTEKFDEQLHAELSGSNATSGITISWYRGTTDTGIVGDYYTIVEADINQTITARATATGLSSYVESSATATIEKADGPAAPSSAPVLSGAVISDNIQVIPEGGQEYSINGGAWQAGGNFSGLTPNTEYSIITRFAETATHKASANSLPLTVTTTKVALTGTASITGIPTYGQTLTAVLSADSNITGTPSYQWKRGSTDIGTNSDTYVLVEADIGQEITVEISSNNETGTRTSLATPTIGKATASAPSKPVAQTVTYNSITVTPIANAQYSINGGTDWQEGNVFSGLTELTSYTIIARYKETSTHLDSLSSEGESIITLEAPADALTGTVTISGYTLSDVPRFGDTLTATLSGDNNTGTLSYQWKRGSTNIGANSATYTLVKEDIGQIISVVVTSSVESTGNVTEALADAVDRKINTDTPVTPVVNSKTSTSITVDVVSGQVYSIDGVNFSANGTFTGLNPGQSYTITTYIKETETATGSTTATKVIFTKEVLTGTVTIMGDTFFGATLWADTSALTNDSGTLTYQWKRGSTNIGANSATYTLVKEDIGKTITVTVSTNEQDGSIISSPTAAIAKATPAKPAAPTLVSQTDTTITVTTVSNQEYSINGTTWQNSGVFTGLFQNFDYNVYTRVKETETHKLSAMSDTLSVKTDYTVYTVTFNSQGGSAVVEGETKTVDGKITQPADPTRTGYTFAGWYTTPTGSTKVTFPQTITDNTTTYYAQWIKHSVTGVTITPESATIILGGSENFTATVTANDASVDKTVTWSIVETGIHADTSIDSAGLLIIGLAETLGSITVKAESVFDNTKFDTVTVLLENATKGNQTLAFTDPAVPITKTVGDASFTNAVTGASTTVEYSSSNTDVAVVDDAGTVTIKGAGTATITAFAPADSMYNAATLSYELIVNSGEADLAQDEVTIFDANFISLEDVFITVGGTRDVLVVSPNGDLSGYPGYTFNGGVLGKVEDGSIKITLYKEFLATLDAGAYSLDITTIGGVAAGAVDGEIPTKTNHSVIIENTGIMGGTSGTYTYELGEIDFLSAGIKDGYRFVKWIVSIGKATIENPTVMEGSSFLVLGDATLTAIWEPVSQGRAPTPVYAVTVVNGSGDGVYAPGTPVTIKADTIPGKVFSHWTYDYSGGIVNAIAATTTYTVPNTGAIVTANYIDDANVPSDLVTYKVSIEVEGKGSVSPDGGAKAVVNVVKGEDEEFTFTPETGYIIKDVLVDGVSVGAVEKYTLEDVEDEHTIKVIFEMSEEEQGSTDGSDTEGGLDNTNSEGDEETQTNEGGLSSYLPIIFLLILVLLILIYFLSKKKKNDQ